ncbi:hypothetical protein Patl1_32837 [Pistacia atlantica]|uniref:Uncharacterized protein n=1 Tax=Pistacia atlantica TaxID=434234 RepID=A0ACC1AMN3_9ROSI|nr:hypothetical protein Patl1_32837 [Pistacia atlantica]
MENPIILIKSSEEEEDKEERTIKWRSKVEEFRMISDLSGSENLKAMMEAEGSARRKKRKRAKKRRKGAFCEDEHRIISDLSDFHNLTAMIEAEALMRRNKMEKKRKLESCDQQDVTVNAAKETEQLGKNEAVQVIEASKPGSVQVLDINEPQNLVIDNAIEKEDAGTITSVETTNVEEYGMISDLSGFENVKAMMEAEGSVRRKKRNRAKKRRNGAFREDEYRIISDLSDFHNLKAMIEAEAPMRRNKMEKKRKLKSCDQQDVTVNDAKETEQLGKNEAMEMIEASKPGSVQVLDINEPQNFVIDNANEKEDASTITSVDTMKGIGTDDGANSSEGINLCLPPSGADQAISDVSCCRGVEDTVGAVVEVKKKRRRRKKKRVTAQDKVGDAKEEDTKDNIVLRMLLRKPRYFDPPDCNWVTFSNYGKGKRKKVCFLCGSSNHIWKYCRQGWDCFIRNGIDHLAHNRSKTDQMSNSSSDICLRCRDPGHDMFSCTGDYAADDLKEIQCYICRSFNHLCCIRFPDNAQKQVSCYNCGQSGHLGSACPNSCEPPSGTNPSVACYKCGETGHTVCRCGTNSKDRPRRRLRMSDLLPKAKSLPSKSMNQTGGFHECHPNFVGKIFAASVTRRIFNPH